MAPGASGFADLKASVMRLMELPPETRVHPGHREPTTIGEEWEANPFVRIWRGLDATGDEQVTVWGRPATLKLWAPDYDGGNKAWIVFGDDGDRGDRRRLPGRTPAGPLGQVPLAGRICDRSEGF